MRYFSQFDLVIGYWQVPLTEQSNKETAFSTISSHKQFHFMPFGIETASAIFTNLIRNVLEGIPNVQHYTDNILVAADTSEEYMVKLEMMLKRFKECELTNKAREVPDQGKKNYISWTCDRFQCD